jgi:hypothetical protein
MHRLKLGLVLAAFLLATGCSGDDDEGYGGVGCWPAECEAGVDPVPECTLDSCMEDEQDERCEGRLAYCFEGCVLWERCPDPVDAGLTPDVGTDAGTEDAL